MWLFIWGVITIFIAGISLWSYIILRQQKSCWKAFSDKHKMTYTSASMMESPQVRGRIDGFMLNLYTDAQRVNDIQGQRFVTVIELEMGEGVPVAAAIGTERTKEFINTLVLKKDIQLDHEDWKEDKYIARTKNKTKLKAYLTKKRQDVLMKLFSMKGATVLFFCDEIDAVLRIETSDPLRNREKMERIVKRFVRDIKVMAPTDAERAKIPPEYKDKWRDEDDDDEDDENEISGQQEEPQQNAIEELEHKDAEDTAGTAVKEDVAADKTGQKEKAGRKDPPLKPLKKK